MTAETLEVPTLDDFERSAFERFDAYADHRNGTADDYVARANEYLTRVVSHVLALDQFWDQLCKKAYRDGAEPLHAIRDKIELIWRLRADSIRDVKAIGERVFQLSGRAPTAWLHLDEAEKTVDRFSVIVLDRWQSLEDLEDVLLARISIPNERLKKLAAQYPPPQSWYDETIDVFAPERYLDMAPRYKQGRIVWAELLDPQGRNPKFRPAVILDPTDDPVRVSDYESPMRRNDRNLTFDQRSETTDIDCSFSVQSAV